MPQYSPRERAIGTLAKFIVDDIFPPGPPPFNPHAGLGAPVFDPHEVDRAVLRGKVDYQVRKRQNKSEFKKLIDALYEAHKTARDARSPYESRHEWLNGDRGRDLAELFVIVVKTVTDHLDEPMDTPAPPPPPPTDRNRGDRGGGDTGGERSTDARNTHRDRPRPEPPRREPPPRPDPPRPDPPRPDPPDRDGGYQGPGPLA